MSEGRGPLRDKSVVLTGTLTKWTRDEAEQKIMAAGGRVTSSVSRKTDFVGAGADPRSQLNKAPGRRGHGNDQDALERMLPTA